MKKFMRWFRLARVVHPFWCEFCQKTGLHTPCAAKTDIPFEGKPGSYTDPNRDRMLCDECAEEFSAGWPTIFSAMSRIVK